MQPAATAMAGATAAATAAAVHLKPTAMAKVAAAPPAPSLVGDTIVPALRWCPRPEDLRAGGVSALVMLPQAIAFAVLAGLPPEMGIYSAVIPVIVASLLGPSALLLSGPNTAVAVMLGMALLPLGAPGSHEYLVFASTLTAMVALAQIVAALGGVGRLLALLPRFTSAGLNMGIGLVMLACQIGPAMGLLASRETPSFLTPWVYAQRWADANPWAIVVTLAAIVTGLAFERVRKPWMPSLVAAMLAGALAGWAMDLWVGMDVVHLERIGHLHLALDVIQWPSFPTDELYVLKQLALSAISIALVASLQSVIILQSTKPGADHRDCRRELLAQAGSNLSASVCGGFACSGSFNRTAAHIDAGAITRAAAVMSSLILLALALLAAPAFASVSRPAIAGTLALVGWSMVRSGWRHIAQTRGLPRYAAVGLGLSALIAGIEAALMLAMLFTILETLLQRSGPAP
ncbi:MAG TPA: SulP family inorganic anion transporter [Albitalea sp.]|uniref:SulP family inorganic anion transporter n=1 Tax=Piscinibacter sp. TaxID=1903157 RepID=UPI002ED2A851